MALLSNTVVSGNLRVTNSFLSDDVQTKFINSLVTGTGTAGQDGSASAEYIPALWRFDLNMTPNEGDAITIKIPIAACASGVWVSVNSGSTYYPVATVNTTRLTTQFPVDEIITLVYEKNRTTNIYGTSTDGAPAGSSVAAYVSDRWVVKNYYDTNTTYSTLTAALITAGTSTSARIVTAAAVKGGVTGAFSAGSSVGKVKLWTTEVDVLPAVTSSDNGKVLMVVDGAWAAGSFPSAFNNSF